MAVDKEPYIDIRNCKTVSSIPILRRAGIEGAGNIVFWWTKGNPKNMLLNPPPIPTYSIKRFLEAVMSSRLRLLFRDNTA